MARRGASEATRQAAALQEKRSAFALGRVRKAVAMGLAVGDVDIPESAETVMEAEDVDLP